MKRVDTYMFECHHCDKQFVGYRSVDGRRSWFPRGYGADFSRGYWWYCEECVPKTLGPEYVQLINDEHDNFMPL